MRITLDGTFPTGKAEEAKGKRLLFVGKNEFRSIRKLSIAELGAYEDSLALLDDFARGDQHLILSEANHDELLEAVVTIYTRRPTREENVDTFANALTMNRRLINYLASRSLYLEYSELRLKRRYGDDSTEFSAFTSACRSEFDGRFSYRFADRLRDYSVHCGLPIEHIVASDVESQDDDAKVEICFDIPKLLHVGGRRAWRSMVAELRRAEPLLPLTSVIDEWPDELRRIRDSMVLAERENLDRAIETLGRLLYNPDGSGRPLRVGEWQNHHGCLGLELDEIPHWAIRQLAVRASTAEDTSP